ncbi:hypothetical protein BDF22DRAFT_696421 [Syncephalis plumigaleata]|nr:hypothetical protein BDF22DRAFT_696421 [Syncephalis plumigaleata]
MRQLRSRTCLACTRNIRINDLSVKTDASSTASVLSSTASFIAVHRPCRPRLANSTSKQAIVSDSTRQTTATCVTAPFFLIPSVFSRGTTSWGRSSWLATPNPSTRRALSSDTSQHDHIEPSRSVTTTSTHTRSTLAVLPELSDYVQQILVSKGVDQTISVKHAQSFVPSAISRIRSTMILRRSEIEALERANDYSRMIFKINRMPSNNSLAMGFRVLRRMRDQGVRFHTLSQYNQLMWFYSQHRQISPLWKTFRNILRVCGTVNVITYNHLLNAFGEADFKVISLLLNQMKTHHVEPNTVTYNIVLRLLAKQDNLTEMLKVYQAMTDWQHSTTDEEISRKTSSSSASVLPNEYTYTTLMHTAAKLGHTELLERFTMLMQQNNIASNAVSYTIRINATKLPPPDPMDVEPWRDRRPMSEETRQQHRDILDLDRQLLNEMQDKCITPTQHTYTSLMNRAFKCGHQGLALEYYVQMIRAGITPDIVSYGTLYYGLGLANDIGMAEQYHLEMRNQLIPEGLTYRTILAHVKSRHGYHRDAIRILEPYLHAGQLDVKAAATLLTCYARARNLNAALRAWRRMLLQYGVVFANQVHRPLLMAFARRGETRVVRWLFSRVVCVQNTQLMPMEMIYALLRSYAQRGQAKDAVDLWRQSLYLGIEFTPSMITQLLMACSVAQDAELLAIVEGDLKTLEISLNEYQLSIFIVGLARTGRADLCKALYRQSLECGLWLKEWVHLACGNAGVHMHDIYFMYNGSKHLS